MIRRSTLPFLLSAAVVCAGVSVGLTTGLGAAAGATVQGVWQNPEQVPGTAQLNVGDNGGLSVVSCTAPGECSGAGLYVDGAGHYQSFVVDERRGVWGTAAEVPGSAALNTGGNLVPNAISCASPGNCAVGGNYTDGSGNIQAWVADEVGGVWGDAQELPGTAALNTGGSAMVNSISCAAPGYCAAGGSYSATGTNPPGTEPFVASDVNGKWSAATEVPGTADYAMLGSVSCGAAGDCVAGGESDGNAYVATETGGIWGSAQPLSGVPTPGYIAEVMSVSCQPSGCAAVGTDGAAGGFGVAETGATWGSAWGTAVVQPLPVAVPSGDSGLLEPESLSCTSPGNCTAVGFYGIFTATLAGVDQEGFAMSEASGTWGAPQTVPSLVALDATGTGSIPSVSCPAPGYCAAVGEYGNLYGMHSAVLSEVSGNWGTAQPLPGPTAQDGGQSISCGGVAYCSLGGAYQPADSQQSQAIVVDETPVLSTKTAESLSAPRVTYGHEQAEKVSVTVSAPLGIATGKVRVASDGKTACTITLTGGKGSCKIPAAYFGTGSHALTAAYGSATGFAASSSGARRVSVVKATSKTGLALSVASVRFGREQAEKLTVRVIPRYAGTPGGTVAITAGRVRVCVISLKRATGSCRLKARTLSPGSYQITAGYGGSSDFIASASAAKRLTVTS